MMSSTTHASELFEKLRPICIEIAREPTSCKIDMLKNYMKSNGSTDFSMLTEYILFPLQATVARKNTSMKLKIQAIGCMCVVLPRISLARFDIFQQIFKHVCFFLSSKEPGEVSQDLSEDSKQVLLDCTLILLDSSSSDVLKCIYKDDFMPSLGHCISLLLNVAVKERAKHLAVKAIECIKKFAFISNPEEGRGNDQNITYHKLLSIKLASFLPGISISLSKAVTSDIKQGQTVIIAAIKAWAAHMQVVMNDKFYPIATLTDSVDELTQIMSTLMPLKKPGTMTDGIEQNEKKSLEVKKDKEWYSKTDAKLKILVERVSNLTSHSSWKVRLTMLEFADLLLKNCSKSLATCVPCLFEIVIGLSSDEYVEVSQKSKTIILELNKLLPDQTPIIEIIEENLHAYFTSLPRQIRGTNEGMKLRSLRIIVGYLRVLGNCIKATFNTDHLLKRMFQALIQVLEFDLSDIRIVEQKTQQDSASNFDVALNCMDELNSCQFIYKKKFKHFRDERLLSFIVKICWYLGRYGNILVLVDNLLDQFRSSSVNRKQVVVLINEIVRGSVRNLDHDIPPQENLPKESVDNVRACVKLVLSEYLSKDIWNVRISNDENEDLKENLQKEDLFAIPSLQAMSRKPVSFYQLNSNIQLLCLVLEGIGIFASVLREYFESMLLEVLYPLMEKLGSHNATVSQVAYWSLSSIAVCCKYNSTEELIARNVDYLINSISLNLRHIHLNPHTPAVLNAMLQYGDKGLIPYLEDTLDEMLSLIDYCDDNLLLSLLKVLHSLILALNKWFPVEVSKSKRICKKESEKFSKDTDLRDFFIAQLKLKKESLGEVSDNGIEMPVGEDEQEIVDEDKIEVKDVALHVKFTIKVLEKCTYFLTSKFVRIRLVMLDTTQHGVLVLSNTEDHLLPMIHKLWQPMTKCFSDDELVVRTKSVSVLDTMVNTSGQFMRRRVIKDAFPTLISYLVMQQSVSLKAGAIYTHTLGFKYQLAILNVLGTICYDLEIMDVECDKVLSSIIPYLSQRQPQILQQAAIHAIRILMKLEPDLVWLSLNNIFCPIAPVLPEQCSTFAFTDVQLAGFHSDKNCEFAVNVQKLLGN